MLAVAGLLVALRVGSCPNGGDPVDRGSFSDCRLSEIPSPMTKTALCTAATDDRRCCFINTALSVPQSRCYASEDAYELNAFADCGNDVTEGQVGTHTIWGVDCPLPEAEPSGEAGDLDGATVGTIVVASLIGVALVGGAIAIYLEV